MAAGQRITLLIVDLQVPEGPIESGTQLRESVPRMAGFVFSFTVIGLFWIGHHGLFRRIKALDRSRILLRILPGPVVFLLSIPVAIAQPVVAQYLWLLALFSALVLRRLEPPEPEPTTAEGDDGPG